MKPIPKGLHVSANMAEHTLPDLARLEIYLARLRDPDGQDSIQKDDIMTAYHPHSNVSTQIDSFNTYDRREHSQAQDSTFTWTPDPEPWLPFASRIDFELAEIIADARMSRSLTNRLLKLVNKIASGGSAVTPSLKSYDALEKIWEKAGKAHTVVSSPSRYICAVAGLVLQ